MKQLNWATLGCGVIANELAQALSKEGRTLYSVANRTHEKAQAFAQKYGISKVYDNIDDVFYDPDVDIIYISTPHNTHINYLRKALSNGKHVLCEKSITLNITELDEAISLAKANNVVLAEAMTIYHMPVYKKLNKIISSGQLGRLNLIQVNFGSYKDYNMTNRFSAVSLQEVHCLILVFTHFLSSAGSSRKHRRMYCHRLDMLRPVLMNRQAFCL